MRSLVLIVLLVAPLPALADTLTQQLTVDPLPSIGVGGCSLPDYECGAEIIWDDQPPPYVFDRFDPALGELVSVIFSPRLTGLWESTFLEPQEPFSGPFEAGLGIRFQTDVEGSQVINLVYDETQSCGQVICDILWDIDLSGDFVISDGLDRFAGPGTFDVTMGNSDAIASGYYLDGLYGPSALDLTVAFLYVPEPSTGFLVSLGVIGAAFCRKRLACTAVFS